MSAQYKQYPDDPKIFVGDDGSVWRKVNDAHPERRQWVRRKFDTDKDGYLRCRVAGKTWYVHRLVYLLFVGDLDTDKVICHTDGNPTNNRASNLMQASQRENISHKRQHGTHQARSKHPRALYDDVLVDQVRHAVQTAKRSKTGRLRRGEAIRIATEFEVSSHLVRDISNKGAWACQ